MIDGTRISVWVERAEPLVGHASRETHEKLSEQGNGQGPELRFEGWLGLLRVLSELLLPEDLIPKTEHLR